MRQSANVIQLHTHTFANRKKGRERDSGRELNAAELIKTNRIITKDVKIEIENRSAVHLCKRFICCRY